MDNPCDNDEQINHGSFLVNDQSLTDLVMSENTGNISCISSKEQNSTSESNEDLILRLEAKLLSTNIELQAEKNERIALNNQVELLMCEIDSLKKNDRNQKNELKKMINENDKLRKDISRFSGVRKYAEKNIEGTMSARCERSTQTDDKELHARYTVLKSKLVNITDSLLTALDDGDNDGFTTVSRGRHATSSLGTSGHNNSPARPPTPSEPHRPTPVPRPQMGHCQSQQTLPQRDTSVGHDLQPQRQRIPVVEIGAAARNAARTNGGTTNPPVPSSLGPSSSPPTDHSDYAIIIGSSLVNGLGTKLHSMGISATSYMYRGADIPTIQSRVPYILKPGINPRYVVLQVAGNDATKQDSNRILARYETLIRDIRRRCPSATIVLCNVPPRRGTAKTIFTINDINSGLNVFADRLPNVLAVDVCPRAVHHFRKDCTHFNRHGLEYYAQQLEGVLRNFHQVHTATCM